MTRLPYPDTRTVDQRDAYHGRTVADPYRWLEDTDSDETSAWIDAQNALSASWLGAVGARDDIRKRLTQLWDHPRAGAPWRRSDRWFQLRNTGLQNQDVLWVRDAAAGGVGGRGSEQVRDAAEGEGRVLLDPNTLSEDGTVALTGASVSEDGRLLAYATSAAGSDWLTWRVRDVETGGDLPDVVEWSKFCSAAWTPDGRGFFYARYDAPPPGQAYEQANRDQRLWYHRLGTSQDDDILVYARPDQPEWGFWPEVTYDGRYLVVDVHHGTDPRNRVYYADLARLDLTAPGDADVLVPLLDDFDAGYAFIGNDGPVFYFRTDLGAPRGRIVAVDVRAPERDRWREVVRESDDTLEGVKFIGGRLVGIYLHHASHRIRLFDLQGGSTGEVKLPGLGSVDAVTGNPDDPTFHFTFTAFTRPTSVYRHDVRTGDTIEVWAPVVDLDPEAFVTGQVFVTSGDGTQVPMFLIRRRDVAPPDNADARQLGRDQNGIPTLMWGYGGFNVPVTPMFKVPWVVWVERGGLLAVPNLRGGGEYGQAWHDAGRLANKQNVFDDAMACAQWLVDQGWTRPDKLAIKGRSNGGLLAGACLTQRPDLFGAVVVEVGVLDMLRFHAFTIGWGWASDYGTADDANQFATLLAYSPLHNIKPQTSYPATLVTTGDHDDRVVPGHSLKFAAALQAAQAGDQPVLVRVERSGGHGAGKPTSMLIAERADVLAFLTRALGADEEASALGVPTAKR